MQFDGGMSNLKIWKCGNACPTE